MIVVGPFIMRQWARRLHWTRQKVTRISSNIVPKYGKVVPKCPKIATTPVFNTIRHKDHWWQQRQRRWTATETIRSLHCSSIDPILSGGVRLRSVKWSFYEVVQQDPASLLCTQGSIVRGNFAMCREVLTLQWYYVIDLQVCRYKAITRRSW